MVEDGRPQGADTPPGGYHPNGWCTPGRSVLMWLASLDRESTVLPPQPAPDDRCDECDECDDPRSDHDDGTGACRRLLRPLWDPDDVCWCGRFVEPAPDGEETP